MTLPLYFEPISSFFFPAPFSASCHPLLQQQTLPGRGSCSLNSVYHSKTHHCYEAWCTIAELKEVKTHNSMSDHVVLEINNTLKYVNSPTVLQHPQSTAISNLSHYSKNICIHLIFLFTSSCTELLCSVHYRKRKGAAVNSYISFNNTLLYHTLPSEAVEDHHPTTRTLYLFVCFL